MTVESHYSDAHHTHLHFGPAVLKESPARGSSLVVTACITAEVLIILAATLLGLLT